MRYSCKVAYGIQISNWSTDFTIMLFAIQNIDATDLIIRYGHACSIFDEQIYHLQLVVHHSNM